MNLTFTTGAERATAFVNSIGCGDLSSDSFKRRVAPLLTGPSGAIRDPLDCLDALQANLDWSGHLTILGPDLRTETEVLAASVVMLTARTLFSQPLYRLQNMLRSVDLEGIQLDALQDPRRQANRTRVLEDLQGQAVARFPAMTVAARVSSPAQVKKVNQAIEAGSVLTQEREFHLLAGGGRLYALMSCLAYVPALLDLHQRVPETMDLDGKTPVRLLIPRQVDELATYLEVFSRVFPYHPQVESIRARLARL